MRRIELGGGAVAFELEGQADRIGSLDPDELARRGWKPEVVANYLRYSKQSSGPHFDVSESMGSTSIEGSVAAAASFTSASKTQI
jgi:hypothetical protein